MLRLVHDDKTRHAPYQPPYDSRDYDGGEEGGRNYASPRNRPRRRSVAIRVLLSAVLAIALGSAAGGLYLAFRSGFLEPMFAPLPAAPAATQVAAATAAPAQAQPAPPATAGPAIPDVPSLVILVRNAILALHQANLSGNYTVFRAIAAPGLQQATTPASLSQTFADIRGRGIDLGEVAVANPRLYRDPEFDKAGRLRLTGFFPVGAQQVDFDMLFQKINDRWWLFGMAINPTRTANAAAQTTAVSAAASVASKPTMPEGPVLVELIRGAIVALNQANMSGDYSVLHDIGAPGFKSANSAEKIAESFAALRARQLDLSPVTVIDPKLFRPPAIDQQGYLRLTGFFPSQPEQVNFDLAFQFDAGQWRLFGIGLNTSREAPPADAALPATTDAKPGAAVPIPRLRPQG